jgi:cobalt-zinc-cadmium efflux system outer membrane protein
LQQVFIRGGKRYYRRNTAAWQIRVAEQQWATERQAVLNAVRQAYYGVLLAKLRSHAARRLADISKNATDIANQLLDAGEGDRLSSLQARVEYETAQISLEQAQVAEQAAWRELHALTGLSETSDVHIAADLEHGLPNFDWHSALARTLRESPRVAEAALNVTRARAALDAACAEGVPDVTTQASVMHDTATDETLTGLQVYMPLTIFDRNQGGIQQADAQVIAAQRGLALVEQDLQRQLAAVFNRYAAARQQLERYSGQILPNASESLDLVNRAYRAGEVDYGRVLLAQRRYFDATLAWLDSLEQAWRSAIRIEGVLVEEAGP